MTPKSSKHINIDEILLKPVHWQYDNYQNAKQQLYDLILEIIGKDEEDDLNPFGMMARSTSQNWLRQEQRQKLTNLFKGDNE